MSDKPERHLLVLGPAARSGGSLQYCREALPRIVERWPGPVTFALPPAGIAALPESLRATSRIICMRRSRLTRGPLHLVPSMLQSLRIVRSERPDVVLSLGNISYAGPRIPTVALLNNAVRSRDLRHPDVAIRAYVAMLRAGYRFTGLRATTAIAVSHHMHEVTPARLRRKVAKVVHHGIDVSANRVRDYRSSSLRILLPGSIVPYRGLERVINGLAMDRPPDIRIVVAGLKGSARYERWVRRLVDVSGLSSCVDWRGALPHDELLEEMSASSHVVISSRVEACPNTLLEAAALDPKRPVIAFDDAWSLEYDDLLDARTDEQGFMHVVRATADGSSAETVARRRRALERLSWDRCADETIGVLLRA